MKWFNHLQWEKVKVFVMASMMVELVDPPATLKEHLMADQIVLHLMNDDTWENEEQQMAWMLGPMLVNL